jgi:hypothetical protein
MGEHLAKALEAAAPMMWALAIYLLAAGVKLAAEAWIAKVESKQASERTAFDRGTAMVAKAVMAVEQKWGEDMRAKAADGKLTPDERAFLAQKLMEYGGEEAKRAVGPFAKDAEAWVRAEAEALIAYLRGKAIGKLIGGTLPVVPVPPAGSPAPKAAAGQAGR